MISTRKIITGGVVGRRVITSMGVSAALVALPVAALATGSAPLVVTDIGPIGTVDDSLTFQKAIDAAETAGRPLLLPPGAMINLHGTVYIGNVTIHARGATINVVLNGGFVRRGNAPRNGEGAILTKASPGAGYGMSVVRIAFDELTVNTIRTTDARGPITGLLLENVAGLQGDVLRGAARGTGHSDVVPFDFYSGVQGVRIGRVQMRIANAGGHGGFWIRNFSPTRATADVSIGTVDASGASADELVAIFNSGNPAADLHDIHIGTLIARPDGASGMALSIYRNAGDYDPTKMQRISIDRIDATIGTINPLASGTGGFAVKVHKTAPRIGAVSLAYVGSWAAALPVVFGVRFAPGTNQRAPLIIPSVTVRVDAHNHVPLGSAAMLFGPISTNRLLVRGSGTGFRQVVYGGADIKGVDVQSTAFSDKFRFRTPAGNWSR